MRGRSMPRGLVYPSPSSSAVPSMLSGTPAFMRTQTQTFLGAKQEWCWHVALLFQILYSEPGAEMPPSDSCSPSGWHIPSALLGGLPLLSRFHTCRLLPSPPRWVLSASISYSSVDLRGQNLWGGISSLIIMSILLFTVSKFVHKLSSETWRQKATCGQQSKAHGMSATWVTTSLQKQDCWYQPGSSVDTIPVPRKDGTKKLNR